jgi:hypothetical protein
MRHNNWQGRLHAYVESCKNTSFAYGSFDCGIFAADCIEAITGNDLAAEFRGYKSAREAVTAIKNACGAMSIPKLGEYIAAKHGLREVPLNFAQRGDLVIVSNKRFGIVSMTGTDIYVPANRGITRVPLRDATKAYRIS